MRIQPAIGLLAVALAICLPGCSRNKLATIDISEVRSADRQTAAGRTDSLMGDLQRERVMLEALRRGDNARLIADHNIRTSKAAKDIVNRISDSLVDWDKYRAGLTSASRLRSTSGESDQWITRPGANTEQSKSLKAIKRKYSADYINLNMRIALLESRLATANEQNKKLQTEKLEQAKAALHTVDEAYQAEIKQQERTGEESSAAIQVVESGSANTMDQDLTGGDSISPRLRVFNSSTESETGVGARLYKTSADTGYRKTLTNTCNSIDQTLLLLRRSDSNNIDR